VRLRLVPHLTSKSCLKHPALKYLLMALQQAAQAQHQHLQLLRRQQQVAGPLQKRRS
jgi:hypothetical protein